MARGDRRAHLPVESVDAVARARLLYDSRARDRAALVTREPPLPGGCVAAVITARSGTSDADEHADRPDDTGAVQRAFEQLKGRDEWKLRMGPGTLIEPRPIIRGNEIVLEPHLVAPGDPRGTRYVRGIDMRRGGRTRAGVSIGPGLVRCMRPAAGSDAAARLSVRACNGGFARVACGRMRPQKQKELGRRRHRTPGPRMQEAQSA